MAQDSTYFLDNIDRGAASRSKLNSIFDAIKTLNSGGSAPPSPSAFMLWADTTTGYLKVRDAGNANWINLLKLDSSGGLLQNAGNPNGAVTGAYEGQLLFDTSNNIIWFYSGSGTVWFNAFGAVSQTPPLPANYHDVRIQWVSASQIKILAGSRCRSADNTVDIVFSADHTIDMTNATPTSTTGGRTVAESANAWYFLYVGLDSAGLPLGWIDTANLAGGGSVTNPAAYSRGRRQLKLAIRNNASSDILPFAYLDNKQIIYQNDITVVFGSTANSGTANCAGVVPPIAREIKANVNLTGTNTTGGSCKIGQEIGKTPYSAGACSSTVGVWSWNVIDVYCSSTQTLYWEWASSTHRFDLGVIGYTITEVI